MASSKLPFSHDWNDVDTKDAPLECEEPQSAEKPPDEVANLVSCRGPACPTFKGSAWKLRDSTRKS